MSSLFTVCPDLSVRKLRIMMEGMYVQTAKPFGYIQVITVIFLSFWTDRSGQTVQGYTVCNSLCIFWMHYSKETPSCSTFRVITTNFLGVRIFRKFTVCWACIVLKYRNELKYSDRQVRDFSGPLGMCPVPVHLGKIVTYCSKLEILTFWWGAYFVLYMLL